MASTAWSGSFLFLVLGAIAAIGLVGLVLCVLGWRGRQINDHPVCCKCRFDLSGVVPAGTTTTSTARCPECGSLLDTPNAVRVGERARRPIGIVVGALLLFVSLGSGGYLGFVVFSSPAMNPSKPTLVLRYEARYGGAARAASALKELDARLIAGTLSDGEIGTLVEQALGVQADQSLTWLPEWGDLLLTANSAGKVAASQLLRYVQNAVKVDAGCRKVARIGEAVPAKLTLWGARSHTSGSLALRVVRTEIAVGDEPPVVALNLALMGFSSRGSGTVGLRSPAPAALGQTVVAFRVRLEVRQSFQSTGEPDPALTWNIVQTRDIEVIPKDQPVVEVLRDDTLGAVLKGKLKVRDVRFDPAAKSADGSNAFSLMIDYNALPVPISFQAFLRWPTPDGPQLFHEERLGESSLPAGGNGSHGLGGRFTDLPKVMFTGAHIVIRPSLWVAERDSAITQTWLGPDLEFPDTPVLDQRGPGEIGPK